jgi:hypothetical protein
MDQSGAAGLYCFFEKESPPWDVLLSALGVSVSKSNIPALSPFGLKGAAFATLGESPVGFMASPLTERLGLLERGVKLGESTLRRFFALHDAVSSADGMARARLTFLGCFELCQGRG